MKNESVISRIISAIKNAKVAVRENLFYDTFKGAIDFADDDLINKRTVAAMIAGGGLPATIITAGVDGTPTTVAYTMTANPGYVLINTGSNLIDNLTNVSYDGANFTILGADDGTGKFADSFTFTIKP